MTDFLNFIEENTLYMVLSITLIIWAGIFFYLNKLNSSLKRIEAISEGNKFNNT